MLGAAAAASAYPASAAEAAAVSPLQPNWPEAATQSNILFSVTKYKFTHDESKHRNTITNQQWCVCTGQPNWLCDTLGWHENSTYQIKNLEKSNYKETTFTSECVTSARAVWMPSHSYCAQPSFSPEWNTKEIYMKYEYTLRWKYTDAKNTNTH